MSKVFHTISAFFAIKSLRKCPGCSLSELGRVIEGDGSWQEVLLMLSFIQQSVSQSLGDDAPLSVQCMLELVVLVVCDG